MMKVRYLLIPLVISLFLSASIIGVVNRSAKAFDTTFFDDSGASCDVSGCATTTVKLVVGESQFVQRTGVNVRAYFTTGAGGTIVLYNANFCPTQAGNPDSIQNGDYYDTHALANGTNVTQFNLVYNGSNHLVYGKKETTTASCNANITINTGALNAATNYDHRVGNWFVDVIVDPINLYSSVAKCTGTVIAGCDGILNYFSIAETSANRYLITQKASSKNGYEVTMQETAGANHVNYYVRFGSDCSVQAKTNTFLYYYDIDNDGGAGAQLGGKVKMQLRDTSTTPDTWWTGTAWTTNAAASWTPPSNNNNLTKFPISVLPNHKYIWYIENVYKNNTIQYSTPYDGIFAIENCQEWQLEGTTQVKKNAGAYRSGTINVAVGDTVYFQHSIKNIGPVSTGAGAWKYNIYWYNQASGTNGASITGANTPGNNLAKDASQTFTSPATAGLMRVIQPSDLGKVLCQRIWYDPVHNVAGSPADRNGYSAEACVRVVSLPSVDGNPTQYEKGSGASVPVTADISCGTFIGAVSWSFADATATIPGASGTSNCTAAGQKITITNTINNPDNYPVDTYNMNVSITYAGGSDTAVSPLSIYTVPYARFYGNDVLSQGTLAFNVNGSVAGSGSQYAAIAANLLAGATAGVSDGILLNSAQFRGATTPASPDGLKATWDAGGAMPDPHAVASYLPKTVTGTADPGAWPTAVGKYYYDISGDVHITGIAGTSGKITVHADNIYIDGNIITNNVTGLGFNDTATPVIVLYANQNIFIAPNVQRVDAIIIGGTVHTCNANGDLANPSPARNTWHASCATKLTINGSVGADNVIFARTQGTRLKAIAGENSGVNGNQVTASAGSLSEAAEIINFPNYLYFASPNLESGTIGATPYQSLFSAPPIL